MSCSLRGSFFASTFDFLSDFPSVELLVCVAGGISKFGIVDSTVEDSTGVDAIEEESLI
jgi:hypothetical protein